MEHLFNYTRQLSSEIKSLIEDMAVLQRILTEKKSSELTLEKMQNTKKEVRKKLFFLRILQHISYLENYKSDIGRAISSLETFLDAKTYAAKDIKRITYYLSSLGNPYQEEEEKEVSTLSGSNTSSAPIAFQTVYKLEDTMRIIEEILLSFYGFASPIEDLEDKLIKTVEALFDLELEKLQMEEKLQIEDFFTHIQDAFQAKSVEGWETAFVKCTDIMNTLKTLAGMDPDNSLEISIESVEGEDEVEEIITFEPWSEEDEKKEQEDKKKKKKKNNKDDKEEK